MSLTIYIHANVTAYMEDDAITGIVFDGGWEGDSLGAEDNISGEEVRLTDEQCITLADAIRDARVQLSEF